VVTLGIKSIQDNVYASAALGLHELASLHIFLVISLLSLLIVPCIAASYFLRFFVKKLVIGKDDEDTDRERFAENRRKRASMILLTATLFGTLSGASFFVSFLMVNQQNLIASFFHQRLTIIHPYVLENEFIIYNSTFARLKTKEEYLSLMEKMKIIAEEHGIDVPKAETW
jgi:hypothetical protein